MKKREIELDNVYAIKVSNKIQPVRILRVSQFGGWHGVNVLTGREIRIKSATKCRYQMVFKRGAWVSKDLVALDELIDMKTARSRNRAEVEESWDYRDLYVDDPSGKKEEV